MRNISFKKQLVILSLAAISACSPIVENKGYVKKDDLNDKVVVGETTKQDVMAQFGSPSSQSTFGAESWYYIHNRKETTAFFKPELVDQDITRIEFDETGIVTAVKKYGADEARHIKTVSRITPTEGHTMSFIEQTLGNVGRFNNGSSGTLAKGRQPGSSPY